MKLSQLVETEHEDPFLRSLYARYRIRIEQFDKLMREMQFDFEAKFGISYLKTHDLAPTRLLRKMRYDLVEKLVPRKITTVGAGSVEVWNGWSRIEEVWNLIDELATMYGAYHDVIGKVGRDVGSRRIPEGEDVHDHDRFMGSLRFENSMFQRFRIRRDQMFILQRQMAADFKNETTNPLPHPDDPLTLTKHLGCEIIQIPPPLRRGIFTTTRIVVWKKWPKADEIHKIARELTTTHKLYTELFGNSTATPVHENTYVDSNDSSAPFIKRYLHYYQNLIHEGEKMVTEMKAKYHTSIENAITTLPNEFTEINFTKDRECLEEFSAALYNVVGNRSSTATGFTLWKGYSNREEIEQICQRIQETIISFCKWVRGHMHESVFVGLPPEEDEEIASRQRASELAKHEKELAELEKERERLYQHERLISRRFNHYAGEFEYMQGDAQTWKDMKPTVRKKLRRMQRRTLDPMKTEWQKVWDDLEGVNFDIDEKREELNRIKGVEVKRKPHYSELQGDPFLIP